MHVLFVAQQWEPEKGVPQRRGKWMVDQLTASGHTVSVVAPPPHYPSGTLLSPLPTISQERSRDSGSATFSTAASFTRTHIQFHRESSIKPRSH